MKSIFVSMLFLLISHNAYAGIEGELTVQCYNEKLQPVYDIYSGEDNKAFIINYFNDSNRGLPSASLATGTYEQTADAGFMLVKFDFVGMPVLIKIGRAHV